jgi:hypothetical protein
VLVDHEVIVHRVYTLRDLDSYSFPGREVVWSYHHLPRVGVVWGACHASEVSGVCVCQWVW